MPTNQTTNNGYLDQTTNPLTINSNNRVTGFSVKVLSGTCQITGTGKYNGAAGSGIVLDAGGSFTETAIAGSVLDGYTITPSGTIEISMKFW